MKHKALFAFLILVSLLSGGFVILMMLLGKQANYLAAFYMLTPAIAAIITRTFFYENKFKDARLNLGKLRDYFRFWIIALAVTALSAFFYTLLGAIKWDLSGQIFLGQLEQQMALTGQNINDLPQGLTPQIMLILFSVGGLTVFGIFPGIIAGFGEEFGWRGLMFPLLYRIKPWLGFIAGGLIWFLWHVPLMLIVPAAIPLSPGQTILNILVLAIGSLCTFAFLVYVYLRSKSIWVVSFAHITINNSQRVLSYYAVLQNQLLANFALTITMLVVVGMLILRKDLKFYN